MHLRVLHFLRLSTQETISLPDCAVRTATSHVHPWRLLINTHSYACSLTAMKLRSQIPRNGDAVAAFMTVSAIYHGFSPGIAPASIRAARPLTECALNCGSNPTVMVGFSRIARKARLGDGWKVIAEASSHQY